MKMNEFVTTWIDQKRGYILVVDNKTTDLFSCSMLLQRFGYRVCTVNTAGQALEMISVALPALVIADIYLPGMSGIELLRLLRQDVRACRVPVIFFVPADDQNAERRSKAEGTVCILKPMQAEDLYRTVQAVMEATPRSSIRISTLLTMTINNVPLDKARGECVSDLSEYGLYVRVHKPYPRNEPLSISLDLNSRNISADTTVLYCHTHGDGPFREPGMGLKFLRIDDADRQFITRFIHDEITRGLPRGADELPAQRRNSDSTSTR